MQIGVSPTNATTKVEWRTKEAGPWHVVILGFNSWFKFKKLDLEELLNVSRKKYVPDVTGTLVIYRVLHVRKTMPHV